MRRPLRAEQHILRDGSEIKIWQANTSGYRRLRDRLFELDAEMDVTFLELEKYLEQQSREGKL